MTSLLQKIYGIDVDMLSEERIINHDKTFWTILQCQSDRLYHYYYDEEKKLLKSSHLLRSSIKTAGARWSSTEDADSPITCVIKKLERELLGDIEKLGEFLRESKRNFIEVLEKFDDFYGTSVSSAELATLEETHAFLDLGRLEYLNERVVQIVISAKEGLNQQQQVVEQSSHVASEISSPAEQAAHRSGLVTKIKRRISFRSKTESGSSKPISIGTTSENSTIETKSWTKLIRSRRKGRRESVGATAIHQIELMVIDQKLIG